jgi:hypothetical protein
MQVQTKSGDIFTNEQTIHPFTEKERMFNEKEANSTANCIGGCGTNQVAQEYVKDASEGMQKLNEMLYKTLKPTDNRPGKINVDTFVDMDTVPSYHQEHFISQDNRYIDPTSPDIVTNATPKDFTYNSYADWRAPSFNQWTRIRDDNCNEENRLRIGSKPMKYYVNQYNSPQTDPFQEYSVIGNQKAYGVRNEFERAMPTRLNPIYPVQVEPYLTTPFLGQTNPNRMYDETSGALRWGSDLRNKKSENSLAEKDYNRYQPGVASQTVQNAGQFAMVGGALQAPGRDGYYDYNTENNIIFSNSATPYFGLSTRDLLHNLVNLSGC